MVDDENGNVDDIWAALDGRGLIYAGVSEISATLGFRTWTGDVGLSLLFVLLESELQR